MKEETINRLYTSLKIIELNKLNLDIHLKILSSINHFKNLQHPLYERKEEMISIQNYDNKIEKKYNCSINEVIEKNKSLLEFVDSKFYGGHLTSQFISSRIIRDIINKLFIKTVIKADKREITFYSKKKLKESLIDKIDSILNFFDRLTSKRNYYKIDIFLSNKKKKINFNNDTLLPDNINSGLTLPGSFICLFRNEELIKVLFHELVHYLNLDMRSYQDKFKKLYSEINLNATVVNPNEAYTEILALLFMSMWKYVYYKYDRYYDINTFISRRLTIELGWDYFQIYKILNFFKCYKSYEDLFTNNCEFKQESNVLSYYILKTYFLQNISRVLNFMSINNLYINKEISDDIFNNINLMDDNFKLNINNIFVIDKSRFESKSLRMTCLD